MQALLAAMFTVLVLVQPVWAADLSGIWVVDRIAWRQQLDGVIAAMLARMPPELVAQARAQGMDPGQAFRDAASEGLDGTIEFLPNGVVRSVSKREGATEDGRWVLDGDRLRVEVADADGLEALVGSVAADRITLRPIFAEGGSADAFTRDIAYPLIRQP